VYTPLVCGVGQAVISGIVEGVGADLLRIGREEQPDRCCGLIQSPMQND
jgi:hypothetical protein